jgi:PII-like signaling protein
MTSETDPHELTGEGLLLRIFIGESDQWEGKPLHEAVMLRAREAGLAGCTVVRAHAGYGAESRIHTAKILRLSLDLPMVLEIVDTPEKVRAFLPEIEAMVGDGLATLEPVEVHLYRGKKRGR